MTGRSGRFMRFMGLQEGGQRGAFPSNEFSAFQHLHTKVARVMHAHILFTSIFTFRAVGHGQWGVSLDISIRAYHAHTSAAHTLGGWSGAGGGVGRQKCLGGGMGAL